MHGRLKVRTTAEQEAQRKLEKEKKLHIYKTILAKCLSKNKNHEYDDECLKLCEDILYGNPDVLTLWNIRKKTLVKYEAEKTVDELDKYFEHDIYVTEVALRKNPKSYGSWSHRQWCLLIAEKLKLKCLNWQNELFLCNKYLNMDERNFHCWSFRQFVIKNGGISKFDELKYTYERICTNFSNYSSWHYRSKLITDLYLQNTQHKDPDIFKNELSLIENAIFTDPNDQAAWIYQKWLLLEHLNSNVKSIELDDNFKVLRLAFASDHLKLPDDVIYFRLGNIYIGHHLKWAKSDDGNIWLGTFDDNPNMKDNFTVFQAHAHIKIEICLRNIGTLHLILAKAPLVHIYAYKATLHLNDDFKLDNQLIVSHLNNLRELSALEMNKSKWCLLTLVQLMHMLDNDKYKTEIVSNLESLATKVDTYRRNFYIQLKESIFSQHF
jgi:geranylgeranyl transferase type-2 subunit alpha